MSKSDRNNWNFDELIDLYDPETYSFQIDDSISKINSLIDYNIVNKLETIFDDSYNDNGGVSMFCLLIIFSTYKPISKVYEWLINTELSDIIYWIYTQLSFDMHNIRYEKDIAPIIEQLYPSVLIMKKFMELEQDQKQETHTETASVAEEILEPESNHEIDIEANKKRNQLLAFTSNYVLREQSWATDKTKLSILQRYVSGSGTMGPKGVTAYEFITLSTFYPKFNPQTPITVYRGMTFKDMHQIHELTPSWEGMKNDSYVTYTDRHDHIVSSWSRNFTVAQNFARDDVDDSVHCGIILRMVIQPEIIVIDTVEQTNNFEKLSFKDGNVEQEKEVIIVAGKYKAQIFKFSWFEMKLIKIPKFNKPFYYVVLGITKQRFRRVYNECQQQIIKINTLQYKPNVKFNSVEEPLFYGGICPEYKFTLKSSIDEFNYLDLYRDTYAIVIECKLMDTHIQIEIYKGYPYNNIDINTLLQYETIMEPINNNILPNVSIIPFNKLRDLARTTTMVTLYKYFQIPKLYDVIDGYYPYLAGKKLYDKISFNFYNTRWRLADDIDDHKIHHSALNILLSLTITKESNLSIFKYTEYYGYDDDFGFYANDNKNNEIEFRIEKIIWQEHKFELKAIPYVGMTFYLLSLDIYNDYFVSLKKTIDQYKTTLHDINEMNYLLTGNGINRSYSFRDFVLFNAGLSSRKFVLLFKEFIFFDNNSNKTIVSYLHLQQKKDKQYNPRYHLLLKCSFGENNLLASISELYDDLIPRKLSDIEILDNNNLYIQRIVNYSFDDFYKKLLNSNWQSPDWKGLQKFTDIIKLAPDVRNDDMLFVVWKNTKIIGYLTESLIDNDKILLKEYDTYDSVSEERLINQFMTYCQIEYEKKVFMNIDRYYLNNYSEYINNDKFISMFGRVEIYAW